MVSDFDDIEDFQIPDNIQTDLVNDSQNNRFTDFSTIKITDLQNQKSPHDNLQNGTSHNDQTIFSNLPNGIPGTQKIFVKTWGCPHNNSDSEYMAGLLDAYGYKVKCSEDEADLWLLNSCTVKGPSQQTFLNYVDSAKSKGKLLVVYQ